MRQSDPPTSGQIDECCDAFESAWRTNQAKRIEEVLSELPQAQHPHYLKALLAVEVELRTAAGDAPKAEELHRRFPGLTTVVDEVLGSPTVRDSMVQPKKTTPQETIAPRPEMIGADAPTHGQKRIPGQLGRYRIVRKLGHGAMGSVFLAHDKQLDRQVALKIPRGDMQRNRELRTRFVREARAAAALDHPNICKIHDIGSYEGIYYICMGYIEGFPLTKYAIAESGLTERVVAELVLKLAKALAVAHKAGFIHRDLKPANVMVDHDGEPVILDFGLARRVDRNEETRVTQTGAYVGSPAYMSPEQVDGDQDKIGPATDIYSLGVILYELLTGKLPFEGSIASVMGQIMTKQPGKPSNSRKNLSVPLENICLKMMAKKPSQRHPSMNVVAQVLQEYLDKYAAPAVVAPVLETEIANDKIAAKWRQQIESLTRAGEYAQAEKLAVRLSQVADPALAETAAWAEAEIPKLRKVQQDVRAGRQEIYNTAAGLMKACDFEQAVRLLQEYPYDLRTSKMQELLEQAESQAEQVRRLRWKIKNARTRRDNDQMLALAAALLKIKPNDRPAKELHDKLMRKRCGPISMALGKTSPKFIDGLGAAVQWLILLGCVGLGCCFLTYPLWNRFLHSDVAIIDTRPPQPQPADTDTDPSLTSDPQNQLVAATTTSIPFPADAKFYNARPLKTLNVNEKINGYPWISPDGLTIWWTREGDGNSQIYQASRRSLDQDFGGERIVSARTRLAAISSDGKTMFALVAGGNGQLTEPRQLTRTSMSVPFANPVRIRPLSDLNKPKCFGLTADGTVLSFQHRPHENQPVAAGVLTRDSRTEPWRSITPIKTASKKLVHWSQLLEHNSLMLCSESPDGNVPEQLVVHYEPVGPFKYSRWKPVSIDGKTDQTIRSPRYCPQTGELFYTLCTGPPDATGRTAELWVAKAAKTPVSTASVASQTTTNQSWTPLLTGNIADNWEPYKSGKLESNWRLRDGVLTLHTPGKQADIATKQDYSDFELEFEWKVPKGGNSGVVYLAPHGLERPHRVGPEYQTLDNVGHPNGRFSTTSAGSIYGIAGVNGVEPRPVGQWNRGRIFKQDRRITHWLNGQKTAEIEMNGSQWRQATSRLKTISPTRFCKSSIGRIALQDWGTEASFRNMRIRRINRPSAQRPLTPYEILTSPDWVWTEPTHCPIKVKGHDDFHFVGATLSDDGLSLIAAVDVHGKGNFLCRSTRSSPKDSFPAAEILPTFVKEPGRPQWPAQPCLRAGDDRLIFSARPFGKRIADSVVWQTRLSATTGTYDQPTRLTFKGDNAKWNAGGPYLTPDGLTLLFHTHYFSEMPKGELWMTTRQSPDEMFERPIRFSPPINSKFQDYSPTLSGDRRVLMFSSSRGSDGEGVFNIWTSTRSSPTGEFGVPVKLPSPINTPDFNDRAPELSADGRTLLFTSTRDDNPHIRKRKYGTFWISQRVPRTDRQAAK